MEIDFEISVDIGSGTDELNLYKLQEIHLFLKQIFPLFHTDFFVIFGGYGAPKPTSLSSLAFHILFPKVAESGF